MKPNQHNNQTYVFETELIEIELFFISKQCAYINLNWLK